MSSKDIAMLAARDCVPGDLRYPLLASIKYDGIRCLVKDRVAMSRSNIPLPNLFLQEHARAGGMDHFDGELIVGPPEAPDCYNRTQSAISTRDGQPDFRYYIFDHLEHEAKPYDQRSDHMLDAWRGYGNRARVIPVTQHWVRSPAEVEALYVAMLAVGHEGLILRSADAPYKRGRGTLRKQDMMKLKPRHRSEALVVGVEELMRNTNEAFEGERGQTKRSHEQAGMMPGGTLGALVVEDLKTGVRFKIGTFKGLTAGQKLDLWLERDEVVNRVCAYEYCPIGVIDKPRQPAWVGWREGFDL